MHSPSWALRFGSSLMPMIENPAQNAVNQKANLLAEKWLASSSLSQAEARCIVLMMPTGPTSPPFLWSLGS